MFPPAFVIFNKTIEIRMKIKRRLIQPVTVKISRLCTNIQLLDWGTRGVPSVLAIPYIEKVVINDLTRNCVSRITEWVRI